MTRAGDQSTIDVGKMTNGLLAQGVKFIDCSLKIDDEFIDCSLLSHRNKLEIENF